MINGCVAKNKVAVKVPMQTKTIFSSNQVQSKNTWKKVNTSNKEDCIDCYATGTDNSKLASSSNNTSSTIVKNSFVETKSFGAYDYTEKASDTSIKVNNYMATTVPAISSVNSAYGTYSSSSNSANTAIQVGAFREYVGATKYMKRYNALSNKYKVTIKTGSKNGQPLHRVRIEGFKTKAEAKKFMYSYGINDAFVVRK